MSQITTYLEFVSRSGVADLAPLRNVEDIEKVARIANNLPHWFDQRRATGLIAKRVEVDADLIHRLMVRGAK